MVDAIADRKAQYTARPRMNPFALGWRRVALLFVVLVAILLGTAAEASGREGPVKIGVLTTAAGPTPQMVGLRDGLEELGYREDVDFIIGVRFTRGDTSLLPAAVRDLVR